MDLHPYDGVTRRFRDDDADPAVGREIVARVLHREDLPGLRYDMTFYSGGTGVFDALHISVALDGAALASALGAAPWPALDSDEEVQWLVGDWTLAQFVDEHRADSQPPLADEALAWFVPESGVNHWELLYEAAGAVHYIAFDRG